MANVLRWHKPAEVAVQQQRNPFLSMQQDLDRAFNEFYGIFSRPRFDVGSLAEFKLNPAVDIVDTNESFKVECELPGLGEEDVKLTIAEGLLTVKAEKTTSKQDKDKNYLLREINYGSYERNIALPDNVDINKAKATFKKGMLWIDIPKKIGSVQNIRELKVEKVEK